MANEKFTIVKDRKSADVTIKKGQKVYVEDNKKGLGGSIIVAIVCFCISPLLVFKAMPLYGKLLSILYLLGSVLIILEPRFVKSRLSISSKYYSGISIYQKISYVLIGATYLFFCRNCFVQFINFRKYDYINADFTYTMKWLYICSLVSMILLLVTRFLTFIISNHLSIMDALKDEKIFWAILGPLIILTIVFGQLGLMKNDASSKTGPLININELTNVQTYENNVVLEYSFHNNTKTSVSEIKNIHIKVTNDTGNTVAEKTFDSVLTGWWDGHKDHKVSFTFDFPNEADATYFKTNSQVSLTTEISGFYLD